MVDRIIRFCVVFCLLIIPFSCSVKYQSLNLLYQTQHDVRYEKIVCDSFFKDAYLVWVEQPLDHNNSKSETFWQRIWVSHMAEDRPVVMITEGYTAPMNYVSELARLINGNQIVVEHRFFGKSVPDSLRWEFLTAEQAAKDHQRIINLFKKVYSGKWITAGISKGGQAALIHRAFFPKEVDATVAYVAPFNLKRDDDRLISFLESVGTPNDRAQIRNFQMEVLKRRQDILPMFIDLSHEKNLTYKMGYEKAFELSVLEFPFSVWQWCVPINRIPKQSATSRELFDHLYRGIDFSYFSEQEADGVGPFFYQAYKELGYYGYLTTPFAPYLKAIEKDTISSDVLIPSKINKKVEYSDNLAQEVLKRLHKYDPRIIHITGANDPWSATSVDVSQLKNSFKAESPTGCHLTRINTLPDSVRYEVINLLNKWGFTD